MSEDWVPFGLDADQSASFRVLVPGVPEWLRESLIAWLSEQMKFGNDTRFLRTSALLDVQARLHLNLGVQGGGSNLVDGDAARSRLRTLDSFDLLRVVDLELSSLYSGSSAQTALERLLTQARSAYAVGTRMGKPGLVDRVPEGVRVAAEDVAVSAGSAGPLLARAWSLVHGLVPNDTAAYTDAVRAVEAVAIPLVAPANGEATLGSVITRMRQEGDWRLPLREHDHAPSGEMLVQMLRTLWRGHRDRHGQLDYSDVTHEEAETAVALAVTLVAWFSTGAIRRRAAE